MTPLKLMSSQEQDEALKLDFLQWWHDVGEPEVFKSTRLMSDREHELIFYVCWSAFRRAHELSKRKTS
jgi:alpha-glucosidase (family GH31 glycosyl hydrolase)